jgi:hypothetical protein
MFRITRSVFAVAPFGSIHPYVNYFRNHTGAPWALATIAEPGKYGREWEETPSRSGRANLARNQRGKRFANRTMNGRHAAFLHS